MMQKNIDDILFKPLLLTIDKQEPHLVVFVASKDILEKKINEKGEVTETKMILVNILDITISVESGMPDIQTYTVDPEKIKESVQVVDKEHYQEELGMMSELLQQIVTQYSNDLQEFVKAGFAIAKNLQKDDGKEIVFQGNKQQDFIKVKFNLNNEKITKEDIQKVIGVIQQTIAKNIDIDVSDKSKVSDLKDQLEYAIIEILPSTMTIGDIAIQEKDIIEIIGFIKENQNNEDNENDEDSNSNEGEL